MSHFEKLVTIGKMGHTWSNELLFEEKVYKGKYGSHVGKWFTHGKMVTIEKLLALGQMGHIWQKGSHFEN